MNRINLLFEMKKGNILSVYFTAGYPKLEDTITIIQSLQDAGVDLIEIGMPFSDPLADGPVIQQSSQKALENGMNVRYLFSQLTRIRKNISIPLVLMGYLNPVLQFGVEEFCRNADKSGIDGLILPDLPFELYLEAYKDLFDRYKLHNIFLITPETSEKRIRLIDENSSGFIYMVAASSTTGSRNEIEAGQEEYFKRIEAMNLKNPRLIGFGISNKNTFERACQYANGAIIGSAFIKTLSAVEDLHAGINQFVKGIINGSK